MSAADIGWMHRYPLFVTRFAVVIIVVVASLLGAGSAGAAAVEYTAQLAPVAMPGSTKLAFDGDRITRFAASVYAQTCNGAPTTGSTGEVFKVDWNGIVPLSNGAFTVQGRASTYYGPSDGADFTLSGQISQDHSKVNATFSIANGHSPFESNCAGTWPVIAVPASFHVESWEVPQKRTYVSKDMSFNYKNGVITKFALVARTTCGNGVDESKVESDAIGLPTIQTTSSGKFEIHSLVVDGYDTILQFDLVGRVTKGRASGKITISEPPGGFSGAFGEACGGSYAWSAKPPKPVAPPGPSAYFQWVPIKITSSASTRYYFWVDSLTCSGRANAVRFTISGKRSTVRCSRKGGWASHAVAPSKDYKARVQAVRIKRGRIVKRGSARTEWISMPSPNDNWTPDGLPDIGTPPTD